MLAFWLMMLFQGADAQNAPYPPDEACSEGGTYGMARCLEGQATRWDERMNMEYVAALKRLEGPRAALLRDAQRDWTKYRDANCAVYASHDGTVSQLWSNGCQRDMAKARALELHDID